MRELVKRLAENEVTMTIRTEPGTGVVLFDFEKCKFRHTHACSLERVTDFEDELLYALNEFMSELILSLSPDKVP